MCVANRRVMKARDAEVGCQRTDFLGCLKNCQGSGRLQTHASDANRFASVANLPASGQFDSASGNTGRRKLRSKLMIERFTFSKANTAQHSGSVRIFVLYSS